MKSRISCLFFIVVFTNTYAQSADTVIVYNHIIVYDTIKIYDTVFVYDTVNVPDENFFQKNNDSQNAVLTIDTATKQLSLQIFFQKDTATILSNSILLSENTKNSEAMKKEILKIVTAALLTQSSVMLSQADSLNTNTIGNNGNALQVKEGRPFVIKTVLFKKRNSDRQYEVSLPTVNGIRFKSEKLRRLYFSTPAIWFGQPGESIITHIDTSFVTVRYRPAMKLKDTKEYRTSLKKLQLDMNLSEQEKENKYFQIAYPDSVTIPVSAIKNIRFSRFNNKNKRFYYSTFRTGFNEKFRHGLAANLIGVSPLFVYDAYLISALVSSASISFPVSVGIIAATGVASMSVNYFVLTKGINFKRWKIVQQ